MPAHSGQTFPPMPPLTFQNDAPAIRVNYSNRSKNDLIRDKSWDATELQSFHRHLIEEYEYHPVKDPLVQADQLAVDIEAKEASMDGFINDIITITIDDPIWVKRAKNAASLVIHTIFMTLHSSEPLKWDVPLSIRKL